MGEVLNVVVAVAVIVFIVRWVTSGTSCHPSPRSRAQPRSAARYAGKDAASGPSPSAVLGFRPKNVTIEMIERLNDGGTDSDNIRYDLLRTGNVQTSINTILERGFLPAPPPAYYTLYPRALDSTDTAARPRPRRPPRPQASPNPRTSSSATTSKTASRVSSGVEARTPEEAAGRADWEENAEKREASLRERKAQMILAARQRLLAQQAKEAGSST
ncbi:hypothetical protein EVJ58_g8257 [Rhodofomes roseus]|uniref:CUE domain-containing protein n=1 Tax=Rhodofomes roseus TaxID=34475 RepID=A0A4Y9XZ50_9APHY|nr:hypothetical protein EVJ58_g8257 [Rhodofomes roseus]